VNKRLFVVALPLYAAGLHLWPAEVRAAFGAAAPDSLIALGLVVAAVAAAAVAAARPKEPKPFLRLEGPIQALGPRHGLPRDIAHAAMLLLAIPLVWRWQASLLLALAGIGWFALQGAFKEERRTFWIANALGIVGEWVAVNRLGFWSYAEPFWQGLPLWLCLVWGNLFLLFRRLAMRFEGAWAEAGPVRPALFAAALGWFVVSTLRVVPATGLAYTAVAALCLWGPVRVRDLSHFAVAAVLGVAGEWIGVRAGIWSYPSPTVPGAGLPVTLPLAWGFSAVLFAHWSEGRRRP
jgi:hypothetical protein